MIDLEYKPIGLAQMAEEALKNLESSKLWDKYHQAKKDLEMAEKLFNKYCDGIEVVGETSLFSRKVKYKIKYMPPEPSLPEGYFIKEGWWHRHGADVIRELKDGTSLNLVDSGPDYGYLKEHKFILKRIATLCTEHATNVKLDEEEVRVLNKWLQGGEDD